MRLFFKLICFLLVYSCYTHFVVAQLLFTQHVISDSVGGAKQLFSEDIDSDGDIDLVSAGVGDGISWWENDGLQNFEEHAISGYITMTRYADACDIDDDGDIDILGASWGTGMTWWENNGEQEFEEHTINMSWGLGLYISGLDIDSDDDTDMLCASNHPDFGITCLENDGEENFTRYAITGAFNQAYSYVFPVDMDNDNDLDILGQGDRSGDYRWWENDDDQEFISHTLPGNLNGALSAFGADLDGDEDIDVLGGGYNTGFIWWENDGELGFTLHREEEIRVILSVAGDLDEDGDTDIIISSPHGRSRYKMVWLENDGEANFEPLCIDSTFTDWPVVTVSDVDNDGDSDLLVSVDETNRISWWENNLHPNSPDSFDLYEPVNDSLFSELEVTLRWTTAYDPDPGDSVSYQVHLSTNEEFEVIDTVYTGVDTLFHLEDLVPDMTYWWRVIAYDTNTDSIVGSNQTWRFQTPELNSTEPNTPDLPGEFSIVSAYPNPFNPDLSLIIALPEQSGLKVRIYNILGKQVALLADENLLPGYHKFTLDTENLTSGIYFINATVSGKMDEVRKVLLVR